MTEGLHCSFKGSNACLLALEEQRILAEVEERFCGPKTDVRAVVLVEEGAQRYCRSRTSFCRQYESMVNGLRTSRLIVALEVVGA
jgi:hypothetical protein